MADTGDRRSPDTSKGYDTGLFDPNVHDNQIVALYDTDADARAARDSLVAAGLEPNAVQVMNRQADRMAGGVDYEQGDQGIWGAIKSLFMPDEDAHAYNHAIEKGHAMVVVTPTAATDRHHIIEVLESTDPINFDAKLEEWRQAGYDYSGAVSPEDNRNTASRIPADYAVNQSTVTDQAPAAEARAQASGSQVTGVTGSAVGQDAETAGLGTPGADGTLSGGQPRVGRREAAQGAGRVRSYVADRAPGS